MNSVSYFMDSASDLKSSASSHTYTTHYSTADWGSLLRISDIVSDYDILNSDSSQTYAAHDSAVDWGFAA